MAASIATRDGRFASALSTEPDWKVAVTSVCEAARQLSARPDLALLFVSSDRAEQMSEIAEHACRLLETDQLIGCTGESLVGMGQEIEAAPSVSLWLGCLPDVQIDLFHLDFQATPDGGSFLGWPDRLVDDWPQSCAMLALGEPFSFPADALLQRMNEDHPGMTVVGGMASGGSAPNENRLLLGPNARNSGAVVALMSGRIPLRTVVSQGCRPIGQPLVITKAQRNLIYQLGGKPALDQLRATFDALPNRDKLLAQQGLHIGRVVSEYQEQFEQGDFLIRNVIGIEAESKAVAVGDYVRAGQTVQFHLRDDATADAELRWLLQRAHQQSAPQAALMFTCNGRGTRLFSEPHHDAAALRQTCGDIPVAGLFAQGEMGPIGGRNFLHGFTASLALFD